MKRLLITLALSCGVASALSGTVPKVTRLYNQPHERGGVVATLAAKTPVDIKTCTGGSTGWCAVTAGGKQGWIPRAQVKAKGNCAALRGVGLGDLRSNEASYNGSRDRDSDGLGCDKDGS